MIPSSKNTKIGKSHDEQIPLINEICAPENNFKKNLIELWETCELEKIFEQLLRNLWKFWETWETWEKLERLLRKMRNFWEIWETI